MYEGLTHTISNQMIRDLLQDQLIKSDGNSTLSEEEEKPEEMEESVLQKHLVLSSQVQPKTLFHFWVDMQQGLDLLSEVNQFQSEMIKLTTRKRNH